MEIREEEKVTKIEKKMVLKAKSEKEETERSEGGWSSKDGGVRNCFLKFKEMWRQSWRPGESEDKRQAWRLRERRLAKGGKKW